ncbi:MAG TPA: dienelactone hydrolase family protein [Paralcaligenes sp.]|jgi:phospholipase/carboxylesterase
MPIISKPDSSLSSLTFTPAQGKPEQLFVLLHGESASPDQLLPLARVIRQAFPQALLVLPYGPTRTLPALVARIRRIQVRHDLPGQQTALAGFSQGATMAFEASLEQPDLAGRVLAFSGSYKRPLTAAPLASTLHFLHGANDTQVSVEHVQSIYARLAELEGDATLDVASGIGHELHDSLINRAIYRLQTCIPLRSWEAALSKTLH